MHQLEHRRQIQTTMASSDSEGDIYEIDRILEKRGRGKNVEYFIRWKGFGEEEDSWEPAKNIASAKEVLAEFKSRQEKSKTPRRQSRSRSAAGDAEVKSTEIEKSTQKSSTGTTTKTFMTTKTVTKTQSKMGLSDNSSPEASPTVTRKSLRPRADQVFTKQAVGSETPVGPSRLRSLLQIPENVVGWFQLTSRDLPIMVLVTCLLVIGASFFISGK